MECVRQAFESDLIGLTVEKLVLSPQDVPESALGDHIEGWRRKEVWLVSCRVPDDAAPLKAALRDAGFREIETLVTLSRPAPKTPAAPAAPAAPETSAPPAALAELPTGIRRATSADRQACIEIAGRAFSDDRLHADPLVPDHIADRVRTHWVANDLDGRADLALVAEKSGRVAGFNLLLKRGRDAVIDLIAVDPDFRRQGLGAALIDGAFAAFGSSIDGMRLGTQAANTASLKMYARSGFHEAERHVTFHWINDQVAIEDLPVSAGDAPS